MNFQLGQGIWNLDIKSGNFNIYTNMYSTYGCGSLLKIVVKKYCCLPTPMTLASGGSPMFPLVVHQPAYLSSSAVTPAGSVHKSRGDNVVRMWVQFKR